MKTCRLDPVLGCAMQTSQSLHVGSVGGRVAMPRLPLVTAGHEGAMWTQRLLPPSTRMAVVRSCQCAGAVAGLLRK